MLKTPKAIAIDAPGRERTKPYFGLYGPPGTFEQKPSFFSILSFLPQAKILITFQTSILSYSTVSFIQKHLLNVLDTPINSSLLKKNSYFQKAI